MSGEGPAAAAAFESAVVRAFAPAGPRCETLDPGAPPLMGQDKWLGGMRSPCGRFVYGVPGSAQRVLQISVATGAVAEIGGPFPGKFKWLRGVEVPPEVMGEREFPCGACFALPSNAGAVLRIDPATQSVATVGGPFSGDWLWHGGALAANGVTRTGEVRLVGGPFPGRQKWYGGILAANGAIYGIPQTATGVLRIDPRTDECRVIAEGQLPEGGWKWHGGLATDDGRFIFGFPNNADRVLKVDTLTDEVSLIGAEGVLRSGRHRVPQDGRYKYLGGAIASDGNVYVFPCDAERVLCIEPATDEVYCVGPELLLPWAENKWQNGFRARDGAVYAIPQRAGYILRVEPRAGGGEPHVQLLPCGADFEGVKDKFEGGVMGADGCIYCIPLRAKRVLKVIPGEPSR
uniref:A1 cistron-splicing factor AAR2 n=1 Tax=Tetraselmis sp. GSL018 TaxID=582737 RepID=A0A061RHK2_9CHLO